MCNVEWCIRQLYFSSLIFCDFASIAHYTTILISILKHPYLFLKSGAGGLCCDKCDGKHETEKCPNFKKSRDKHPDAQKNFYKKMGGT